VDESLWRQFKAVCEKRGLKLRFAINQAIALWLEKNQ
jgi:hypothetical protein